MGKKKKGFEDIIESIRDKQAEIDDLLNDLEEVHSDCSESSDHEDYSDNDED